MGMATVEVEGMDTELNHKPPLGLKPRKLFDEHANLLRINEITEAMKRYSDAKVPIPCEWVDELHERMPQIDFGE